MFATKGIISFMKFDGTKIQVSLSGLNEFKLIPNSGTFYNLLVKYQEGEFKPTEGVQALNSDYKFVAKDSLLDCIKDIYFRQTVSLFEIEENLTTKSLEIVSIAFSVS